MRDADSGDCVKCPRGTYTDKLDASSCTSCPEGQTTVDEGANEASLCFGEKTTDLWLPFHFFEIWGKYHNCNNNLSTFCKPDPSCSPGQG